MYWYYKYDLMMIIDSGIRYSVRDLLLTSITMPDPETSDMRHIYGT